MRGWGNVLGLASVAGWAGARLVRANVVGRRLRLRRLAREYHAGRISFKNVQQAVPAWLGHAAFGDTWQVRRRLFGPPEVRLMAAEHGRNAGRVLEQQSSNRNEAANRNNNIGFRCAG